MEMLKLKPVIKPHILTFTSRTTDSLFAGNRQKPNTLVCMYVSQRILMDQSLIRRTGSNDSSVCENTAKPSQWVQAHGYALLQERILTFLGSFNLYGVVRE